MIGNHPGKPVVVAGNDEYAAGWNGRGDLIVIPMACENGHGYEVCLGFHKGGAHAFLRDLKVTQ